MDRNADPPLTADQLLEPPTVHLATGMIAAELDLTCEEAFELLHDRALGDGSLAEIAQKVIRREIPATCDRGPASAPSGSRRAAARREHWAIRDAGDLAGDTTPPVAPEPVPGGPGCANGTARTCRGRVRYPLR